MDFLENEQQLLRDLVKAARQKTIHIKWVDRDGTPRLSTLIPAEAATINKIAHRLGISSQEVLRRGAHIPVAREPAAKKTPPSEDNGEIPSR